MYLPWLYCIIIKVAEFIPHESKSRRAMYKKRTIKKEKRSFYKTKHCQENHTMILHRYIKGIVYISLLIIPCMIVYVTNKEPWTLNLVHPKIKILSLITH